MRPSPYYTTSDNGEMILFFSIKHTINIVITHYIVYDDICLMVRKINYFILFYFIFYLLDFCLALSNNFVDSESGQIQSVKLLQNMASNLFTFRNFAVSKLEEDVAASAGDIYRRDGDKRQRNRQE